jgi:galactokinase/mevalonate kinase-like predicted kinase
VAFFCPTNKQHEVRAALDKMGATFSDFAFDKQGVQVWRSASR